MTDARKQELVIAWLNEHAGRVHIFKTVRLKAQSKTPPEMFIKAKPLPVGGVELLLDLIPDDNPF